MTVITNNQSFAFGVTGTFLQNIKEGGQYNKTCKQLINMIPTVQGHVYSRTGLRPPHITPEDFFVLDTVTFDDNFKGPLKLIMYQPVVKYSYALIFIANQMIGYPIYSAHLANPSIDHKLVKAATPFDERDVGNIRYTQDKQSLAIFTTNKRPYVGRLEKDPADNKFRPVLKPMDAENWPLLRQNDDIENYAVTEFFGQGHETTITWIKPVLKPGHVGSIFAFYAPPSVLTLWEAEMETVDEIYWVYYGNNVYLRITNLAGTKTGKNPPRHDKPGEQATDGGVVWQFWNNGAGFAKCTEVLNENQGKFIVTQNLPYVITQLGRTQMHYNVTRWNEPAFSDVRGWPSDGVFYEGRLILTGVNRNMLNVNFTTQNGLHELREIPAQGRVIINIASREARREENTDSDYVNIETIELLNEFSADEYETTDTTVYGSKVNQFGDFNILDASAGDAFEYPLASGETSGALWCVADKNLTIGTTNGIYVISVITGNKLEVVDFIRDSLSRTLPGILLSNTIFYASDNDNCLKMLITNEDTGQNENTSVSDRAQELTTGIIDLCAFAADKNHVMMLRNNHTITGLYFDASDKVQASGLYQMTFNPAFKPMAVSSAFLDFQDEPAIGNMMIIAGLLKKTDGVWKLVVSYLDINQPPDLDKDKYKDIYIDKFLKSVIMRAGEIIIEWETHNYETIIKLHKQGFLNPGRPYGDIVKSVNVRKVDLNTFGTYEPPLINDEAPDGYDIDSGKYDQDGKLIRGSSAEIVYHYSLNEKNSKALSVTQKNGEPMCVINMDITIQGEF